MLASFRRYTETINAQTAAAAFLPFTSDVVSDSF